MCVCVCANKYMQEPSYKLNSLQTTKKTGQAVFYNISKKTLYILLIYYNSFCSYFELDFIFIFSL